eukprot:1302300-Alexandrium_andersonii.AAC.1
MPLVVTFRMPRMGPVRMLKTAQEIKAPDGMTLKQWRRAVEEHAVGPFRVANELIESACLAGDTSRAFEIWSDALFEAFNGAA